MHYDHFADAPLCVTDKVVIVGAFRNENLNIYCEVHADPPPRFVFSNTNFHFSRNTENQIANIQIIDNGK